MDSAFKDFWVCFTFYYFLSLSSLLAVFVGSLSPGLFCVVFGMAFRFGCVFSLLFFVGSSKAWNFSKDFKRLIGKALTRPKTQRKALTRPEESPNQA